MLQPSNFLRADRNAGLWPMAIVILACVAILAIATGLMLELRANIGLRAQETSQNLLRVVERDITRNIDVLDHSIQRLIENMARPDIVSAAPDVQREVLFGGSAATTGFGALSITDSSGRMRLSSAPIRPDFPGVADRDYFRAHLEPGRGLQISPPHRSRLLDREVVGFSRRIDNPDGSFGGIALASIDLTYFAEILAKLHLGQNGVVTLFRTDGAIIFRQTAHGQPQAETVAGSQALERIRNRQSDTFVGTSAIDGIERLYTFTRVGNLPLVVSLGLATDDIYGRFEFEALYVSVVLLAICLGLIALTARLTRELDRRKSAERALVVSNTELERLSLTDALTGLGNRRAFDTALARELRHAQRTGRSLSLLLVDVDHFKSYNDRYGHQQGDAALADIARVLAKSCRRASDGAFRVGGEEFALILPETRLDGAARVSERIRRAVGALDRRHSGSPFAHLTVSAGYAEVQDDDPASAYERTDAALYRAKQSGRDRACAGERPRMAA
jgi:diguanylate cyclase (GGDEF)-like protein